MAAETGRLTSQNFNVGEVGAPTRKDVTRGRDRDNKTMWLLLEEQKSTSTRPVYFKGWCDYEPVTTENVQEAHRFNSKEEAKLSAAYRHKQSSFVPVEVEMVVVNKAA